MQESAFIIVAVAILSYGLVSRWMLQVAITPAMLFVLVGLVTGPLMLHFAQIKQGAEITRLLTGVTLVLVLFVDAMNIDRKSMRHSKLPRRLLFIGLPLTMILGTLIARGIFPQFNWWEAATLSILLAPTDAALGQLIVTSQAIPYRLREALNVESGLNDGLTLVTLLIVLSLSEGTPKSIEYWFTFFGLQIFVAIVIGLLLGTFVGKLIDYCSKSELMLPMYQRISAIILALLAYSLSEILGGNGFISVFCAGITLGIETPRIRERIFEFGEAEGQQLALITFLIFGGAVIPLSYSYWDFKVFIYALLSLTVIRMVPVAISLIGLKESWRDIAFLGWFGPRGLASILFSMLVYHKHDFNDSNYLISVVVLTVFLSIFAHGITAKLYEKAIA